MAGQGGNAGAQSLAVVMRGIVMREIPKGKVFNLIMKEGTLGAVNGLVIGLDTAMMAYIWYGSPYLGIVIGLQHQQLLDRVGQFALHLADRLQQSGPETMVVAANKAAGGAIFGTDGPIAGRGIVY